MKDKKISNTVIALVKNKKGKLMIAGDRRSSWGYHYAQSMEIPKINKKNNILLGATGNGDMCSLIVDDGGLEFPEKEVDSVTTYMYHVLRPSVLKFLINQGYGYKDKYSKLELPPGMFCEIVLGIEGEAWSLIIDNPFSEDSDQLGGNISLGRVSVPYTTGCGGHGTADAPILYEIRKKGYVTKEELKMILEVVADIAPGCDGKIDIITAD